jgi:tetratricopeptide (TPR) repeat protein
MPRPALLALLALTIALTPGPAAAQTPADLERGEDFYRDGKLLDAADAFQKALPLSTGKDRRDCYDRLIAIYVRIGRQDKAIGVAKPFAAWLTQLGDEARLRELSLEVGECYLALGHYRQAAEHFQRALTPSGRDALPPPKKLAALVGLARSFEFQKDLANAGPAWKKVEEFAQSVLDAPRVTVDAWLGAECGRRIADSYRFQGQHKKAVACLTSLLSLLDDPQDALARRDTLKQLADHLIALDDLKGAERRLQEALDVHKEHDGLNRLMHGELCAALAEVEERRGRKSEANTWRKQAAGEYDAVLRNTRERRPGTAGPLAAFWKLQLLYQRSNQFNAALRLTVDQAERWSDAALLKPRIGSELGGLQVLAGSYPEARKALRTAVKELGEQTPLNFIEYPRALNNLAIVELAADDRREAERLAERCRDLYEKSGLPDDLLIVETFNLLGTCAAQNGDYAKAIDLFRDGISRSNGLGAPADPQRANLMLNEALLLNAQGDPQSALCRLQEALFVFQRYAAEDDLGFVAFAAAKANLLAAQGRIAKAAEKANEVLELCAKHRIGGGPLLVTARHVLALWHLQKREFHDAEDYWRKVLDQQEDEELPVLMPRTLNYLGLIEEVRHRPREAEKFYRRAQELQQNNPRAFPLTHFLTLWRLADLADRRGDHVQGRDLLDKAITVIETARVRTYGDAQQRADFFAQVAPAIEQLVDHAVRDGDVEAAIGAVARGRSRTLMDQLMLAGVDPRASLTSEKGKELARREREASGKVVGLRARAELIRPEAVGEDWAKALLADLGRAEESYAEVWREVLNASPAYRGLSNQDLWKTALPTIRKKVLGPKTVMLAYFIGQDKSYVFLVGDQSVKAEAFALTVSKDLVTRVGRSVPLTLAQGLSGERGLALVPEGEAPSLPQVAPAPGPMVPLTHDLAGTLVDHFLASVAHPHFDPARGLQLVAAKPDRPVPVQRPELFADVFLPRALRERIRQLEPECLVVIPDGALHKLPLEALLLKAGPEPTYALDEMPPIAYAPSIAVLALLADRPQPKSPTPTLLTVADPAYGAPPQGVRSTELTRLASGLPKLPGTATESLAIRQFFQHDLVTHLSDEHATKGAVVKAMRGKRVIHLATHGFADERLGNMFGAIALAPPDGFLSLLEICQLPLGECELAVLSACVTNVGPQRPLEASITLASGFLTAGAHRVVASQWNVSDHSAPLFMKTFFKELTNARPGDHVVYARALQKARKEVRAHKDHDYSSPFYWAPFVLIGPPD